MAAPVQQPLQPGGGKRKGKAQYLQAKRARRCEGGGPRQLEPGLQGILITCNMNERKCVEEAYSLLNEYGDDMYGPEKVPARGRAGGPSGLSGRRKGWQASSCIRMREFSRTRSDEGAWFASVPLGAPGCLGSPPLPGPVLQILALWAFPASLLITMVAPIYRLLFAVQTLFLKTFQKRVRLAVTS